MTPDREPLAQALNSIIGQLSAIGERLANPVTYDEVAAEEDDLWTIKTKIELICSYIKEKEKRRCPPQRADDAQPSAVHSRTTL